MVSGGQLRCLALCYAGVFQTLYDYLLLRDELKELFAECAALDEVYPDFSLGKNLRGVQRTFFAPKTCGAPLHRSIHAGVTGSVTLATERRFEAIPSVVDHSVADDCLVSRVVLHRPICGRPYGGVKQKNAPGGLQHHAALVGRSPGTPPIVPFVSGVLQQIAAGVPALT